MLRLLPETESQNKDGNSRISRRHCRLNFQKTRVVIEDLDSTNGTYVGGRRIKGPVSLHDKQIISLANKLSLRYRDFRRLDETADVSRAMNNCTTALDCTTALSSMNLQNYRNKAPIDGFLLRRRNNFRNKIEYLFLRTSAILGSSQKYAALLVDHESVSDRHARILVSKGQYFIEDLKSRNGTSVDGTKLEPYVRVPLGRHAIIQVGGIEMNFAIPSKQAGNEF